MERSLMRNWKPVGLALVAGAVLLAPGINPAFAAGNDSVVGKWRTPSKHGVVELGRCGESVCGRIVDSDGLKANPDLRDINNKDTTKRTRKVKGLQIVGGFKAKGNEWVEGQIYNPEDGGTYKATITPVGADTLKLKGCIVWPLCKTQTWTRIP
ncbi:uncharacterized protein (DUF2147 family) [Novosphingobium sp. ST904]|nr:uncharacterized protein (DUF2147 family) [Novosphingobium sp. ST904]